MEIQLADTRVEILRQKALWFKDDKLLLLGDLHLGKASHFRKAGIPVPGKVYESNIELLLKILQWRKPKTVIFLGDLFHSDHNREWDDFKNVIRYFPNTSFKLVLGNHDILDRRYYEQCGLKVEEESMIYRGMLLSHEPQSSQYFNIYGHLHPGVRMVGKGRQSLKLPCLHVGKSEAVLPAFGTFTGLSLRKPIEGDGVYVFANNQVIDVSP